MIKLTPNISKFLNALDHARKYLVICNPKLIMEYDNVLDVYGDEIKQWADESEMEQLRKLRYHCMVFDLLKKSKYKKELLETYGLQFIRHQDPIDWDNESNVDVYQFGKLFFNIPYDGCYYWGELEEAVRKEIVHFVGKSDSRKKFN